MKLEVPLRIVVTNPLKGVKVQVQRGKDELLAPTTVSGSAISFEFDVNIAADEGPINFLGKYAQGPKGARFVYVNSGTYAGQASTCWSRRAKLSLMSITEEQVRVVLATPGSVLETTMPGTGRDGGPTCATVKGIVEGSSRMNTGAYLERIGLGGSQPGSDVESLRRLQRSHLLDVPFENLDIHWKRPIVLDVAKFYTKIVEQRRGGFCYELNGLFETLLTDLGFCTRLVSARVFNGKEHGPEFDHAAIIVTIDDEEYLADVGFGAFSAEPLNFIEDVEQEDPNGCFVIRHREDGYYEVMKRDDGVWRSEYIFRNEGHPITDFAEMCDFQQYDPRSHFLKSMLCSIMTGTGRISLTETSFITTENGLKSETPVGSMSQFYEILAREFGIVSPQV